EVQKVMVHRRFRRRGVGLALMRAVDDAARAHGRTTLFLDTFAHQDARRLYERAGWTHAGDIPAFARTAEGALQATSLYYRLLTP
ncbi:MAG TPA: GNAT family N-acetyltransferase, partial [Candidatus Thermoplasmatota archaeon]|nr:GNAT family N-acetyltransferase [Candidatus Thermoplasmatota archaeon]